MTVMNIDLDTVTVLNFFGKIMRYEIIGGPHYVLNLQLEKRYMYQVEMTLNNNKGNLSRTFDISKLNKSMDVTNISCYPWLVFIIHVSQSLSYNIM